MSISGPTNGVPNRAPTLDHGNPRIAEAGLDARTSAASRPGGSAQAELMLSSASAALANTPTAADARPQLGQASPDQRNMLDRVMQWGKDRMASWGNARMATAASGTARAAQFATRQATGIATQVNKAVAEGVLKPSAQLATVDAAVAPRLTVSASVLGAAMFVPAALANRSDRTKAEHQVREHRAGAIAFEDHNSRVRTEGRVSNARPTEQLFNPELRSQAKSWLTHSEASKTVGNTQARARVWTDVGRTSVQAAVDITATASKALAAQMGKLVPGLGAVASGIGVATALHSVYQQNSVNNQYNDRLGKLEAYRATRGAEAPMPGSLEETLDTVAQAATKGLEDARSKGRWAMAASAGAAAGNALSLTGNLATLGVITAPAGVIVNLVGIGISALTVCVVAGLARCQYKQANADQALKDAISPGQLAQTLENTPPDAAGIAPDDTDAMAANLNAKKANLAKDNRFYSLVVLAEKIQSAIGPPVDSAQLASAVRFLEKAGVEPPDRIDAILQLASTANGPMSIGSDAVKALSNALFMTPLGAMSPAVAPAAR